jgi:hypothetical protein
MSKSRHLTIGNQQVDSPRADAMIESQILEQLQNAPFEERIAIIEMRLRSLKNEVGPSTQTTSELQQNRHSYRFTVGTDERCRSS